MVRLYVAMEDALFVATGGPDDWRTTTRLPDRELQCLAVHPDVPERVFCGTFDAGLRRSRDGGETWERVGTSPTPRRSRDADADGAIDGDAVTALAVNPHDPDEVWAGTEPSAVYHSTDGGDEWSEAEGLTDLPSASTWSFPPRPETHHVRWLEVDPEDPTHLYVAVEAGALVQTHDRGETWEDRVSSARRDTHTMATRSDEAGHAWAAAGDGYAETRDGGETWTYPQSGLDHRYCWSVVVPDVDPETVFVSSASGAYAAHGISRAESYVYRKCGDGDWEQLDGRGLPTGEGVLRSVFAVADAGAVYAANNRGLFESDDAGESWERLDVDWPEEFTSQTVQGLVAIG